MKKLRRFWLGGVVLFTGGAVLVSVATAKDPTDNCDLKAAKKAVYGNENEYVPPGYENLICEKAKPLLEDESNEEKAKQNPGAPVPPPEPSPLYYEEGIYGDEETSEVPPGKYEYSEVWRGVVDDKNIAVFSGWEIADPSRGVVLLQVGDPYTGLHEDLIIDAPIVGPLQILEANRTDIVIVSDATGEQATFDAKTRSWR